MKKDVEFSIYELGIIKNSLRDRIVNIEEFREYFAVDDDDTEMNNNIDAFGLELTNIKEKIKIMIENKQKDNCL